MPANQGTDIPAVPVRSRFFNEDATKDYTLNRTWILFFENVAKQQSRQRRLSIYFSSLQAGGQTSHARVPNFLNVNNVPLSYLPISADINAAGVLPTSDCLIDIQQSADDVTFTSILTTPIRLASGKAFAATQTPFIVNPILIANRWVRGIVAGGSDLNATALQVEIGLLPQ